MTLSLPPECKVEVIKDILINECFKIQKSEKMQIIEVVRYVYPHSRQDMPKDEKVKLWKLLNKAFVIMAFRLY
ncbi:hypothetical protein HMPREF1146_1858 [Prevotella sp. MSX73]|nr:hypothetical protein [Segatella buccae]EJP29974.1 hypothetical protein HMPREF1146_1858 [Prevotella sp. MSX73]